MISWNAPEPSPAPPPWIPAAQPDERRGSVLVTPWLRSVLHPRRGGIDVPVRPLASVDQAWAGVRHHVWSLDRMLTTEKSERSRVWGYVTSVTREDRRLGERLLDPAARIGTADDDHALVRAVRNRFTWHSGPADEWLADFLAAAHGLPEAARRIIGGFDSDLPYTGVGVFGRLRQLLVLADDTGYAEARDAILDARDRQVRHLEGSRLADLFWAVSFVLPVGPASGPDERDAHDAAMRNVGEFGNFDVHASGLAAGDVATVERFLHANACVRHEFFSQSDGRLYLASLLDVAGEEAGPLLSRMRPEWPVHDHPHYIAVWSSLLTHAGAGDPDEIRFAPVIEDAQDRTVPPGEPFAYQPPEAVHPVLRAPSVPVEPELDWRAHERSAAEGLSVRADAAQWDGVPIGDCDTAQVTAWLEHHEHWAIPTPFTALALAPRWTHDRLTALGFDQHSYWVRWALPLVLLRHGASLVPALVAAFDDRSAVDSALEAAQPVGHSALAVPVARAFAGKRHRRPARAWLLRHPRHAAAGLVAAWAADPSDPVLGRALRWLDAQGHRPLLLAQASSAADDLRALLELDPLAAPRAKQPTVPSYLTKPPLPGIPLAEQKPLLVRLAASDADQVHPGVLAARTRFTAEDRTAFTDALLDRWLAAGTPPSEAWCLHATGLLGDDTGARRLATLARQWAGTSAAARAQTALDALRHRGTDAALIELNLLAERSRFPTFAAVARGHIEEIAALRGLTPDELADRMVPALDADLGAYRLAFDHRGLPVVRDPAGRVLADLPRKPEFKEARAELAAIRRTARASASLHLARLERAMCTGRRIPVAIFLDRFATHPWMTHLAQRLVWGVWDDGVLTAAVRVAEDGTLATADDEPFAPAASAEITLLHPVEFDPAPWAEIFADYALLQPFPQLDRPVHLDAAALDRFTGRTVSYPVLRGLERHGWTRWYDASMVRMAKALPGNAWAVLDTDPGWHASDTADSALDQTVRGVEFTDGVTFAGLPPVVRSELVHDLRALD